MKEKIKNYLFCLCALAMCLAFALAVFFRASKNVKAAPLQLGSNLTYNEGQTLRSVNKLNGNYIYANIYKSTTDLYNVLYWSESLDNDIVYQFKGCSNTTNSGLLEFTCTSLFQVRLTTINGGSNGNISSTNPSIIQLVESSTFPIGGYELNVSRLVVGSDIFTGVLFSTTGYTYSDGYFNGYNDGSTLILNKLYVDMCNLYNISNCSSTYFTDKYDNLSSVPTNTILSDLLSVSGSSDIATSTEVFNYIKSLYSSNINVCLSNVNISNNCMIWSNNSITLSNISIGLESYINNTNIINNNINYDNAYNEGRTDGIVVGVEEGKTIGYSQGFIAGQEAEDIIGNAVLSVASTPLMVLSGMLNFSIFGFNVLGLVLGLFTFVLVLWILKKVF